MNYTGVKKAFFYKFQPQEDTEVAIGLAIDRRLQDDDFISSVKKAESRYSTADFNESAKNGLLRNSIQGHLALIQFLTFGSPTTYNDLVDAIKMFDRNREEFILFVYYPFDHSSPSASLSGPQAT